MSIYWEHVDRKVDRRLGRTFLQLERIRKHISAFGFNLTQLLLFAGKTIYSNRLHENEYIKNRKCRRLHRKFKPLCITIFLNLMKA